MTEKEERSRFIEENMGLCRMIAGRFSGRGVEYDDLFQAACMGLCKAADRFDRSRGLAFSTYAVPVILGEVKRLFREGGSVKVSRSLKEAGMHLKRVQKQLEEQLGRSAAVSELAKEAHLTEEETAEILMATKCPVSLSSSENGTQWDLPEAGREQEVTEKLSLETEIARLPEKDRVLLLLRYQKSMTQSAAAKELGMTQVQVSRREKKLLALLRQALESE